MEQLNAKLYHRYTALKKRKLLDEGLDQKRAADINELRQAMKDWVAELQSENERLVAKLTQKEQQLVEAQTLLLDETRKTKELNSEILKLQCLLAEKNDANHIATGSPDTTAEMTIENQTPISPAKKTPKSNSRERNIRSIEKAIVPRNGFQEEGRDLDSCRRHMSISGSATEESSSTCMFHLLAESMVGMKFSVKNETEGFSLSVSHEASGYNFTLTWVDQPGGSEWSYQYSSLGTLDRIAMGWMKEDIKFSSTMCPVFFKQISHILRQC
ncbi:uncharacterized protein [Oryza sativa Japonica Group]|uniref:Os06g0245600 protein n=3 Tax=Oryza TaxID=4527 RepID=A3BA76_ORYSJ|nr:uncharacterized protein LOC4340635 [Oryza sativa Japonica Group]EAZ00338.1 hypothetical protein OsI_22354 [Oryza sativa Indica Group]KAB8101940.1 hypothetical protein EE612_033064 [Oryza sativa]EAZ36465.1 hypothetical protein OsJ_20796 [Oryza sativa Japonica Group]KAF2926048.1 hypothetical protein DAI22_06g098400 [Oryza sativa Japonica Group]BAD45806.1 hypothetical protein [Oryza sativa Japonica Group]|eukprot:NP_001057276.1 Os06g0245600 [Oryza sativa Japonica Group]